MCRQDTRVEEKTQNAALIDTKDANMQVRASESCSINQIVRFKGKTYRLTRLAFGLSCSPEIMRAIVIKVLSVDENVCRATDSYYDDIFVDLDMISVDEVHAHLMRYGLKCKPHESLERARVLGLQMRNVNNDLVWERPAVGSNFESMLLPEILRGVKCFQFVGKWLAIFQSLVG